MRFLRCSTSACSRSDRRLRDRRRGLSRQVEHLATAASHAAGVAQQLMEDQPELAAADLAACDEPTALTGTQEPDEPMLDALFTGFAWVSRPQARCFRAIAPHRSRYAPRPSWCRIGSTVDVIGCAATHEHALVDRL